MSREIKFRAWDGDQMLDDVVPTCSEEIVELGEYDWTTRSVVVEQYTGLKDKNGKEIYEGDIVDYAGECTCVIQYEDEGARFIHRDISDDFPFGFNGLGEYNGKLFEVIGNIHENPELLKEAA